MKNKKLYYSLSYSWGIIAVLIGKMIEFVLAKFCKKTSDIYGPCHVYHVGKSNWGGFSIGHTILTDHNPSEHILNHEFGHTIQNAMFGPFYLVILGLSACRYWLREIKIRKGKGHELPPYDSVWYEGTATKWGTKYIEYYK